MSLCLYSNSIGLICGGYPQHFDTSTTITNSRSLSFSSSLSSLLSHRSNHVYIWWTNRGEERRLGGAKPPSGEFSPPPNTTHLAPPNFCAYCHWCQIWLRRSFKCYSAFSFRGLCPLTPHQGLCFLEPMEAPPLCSFSCARLDRGSPLPQM